VTHESTPKVTPNAERAAPTIDLAFILRDTSGDIAAAQRRINRVFSLALDEVEKRVREEMRSPSDGDLIFVHERTKKVCDIHNGRSLYEDHADKYDWFLWQRVGPANVYYNTRRVREERVALALPSEDELLENKLIERMRGYFGLQDKTTSFTRMCARDLILDFRANARIVEVSSLVSALEYYADGFTEFRAMDGNNYFEPKDGLDGGTRAREALAKFRAQGGSK